jgi:predicted metal-dependent enzyme (double-stranded beta helix superfamily)
MDNAEACTLATSTLYTVDQFAAELIEILDALGETKEAVFAAGPLLQRLAREGGDLSETGAVRQGHSGLPGRLLHADPQGRFILSYVRFPANVMTDIHSHEAWGAMCLLSGSERYTSWNRQDDGSRQGEAKLAVVEDHHMEPGDLAHWFSDPYNIHRQWTGGAGCHELNLMGRSGQRVLLFDAEKGTWEASPPAPPVG